LARHPARGARDELVTSRILRAVASPFYNFVAVISWPVMHGLYRLEERGRENLPEKGGFVLAANHNSNFDPWPLGLPLWPHRELHFMAKAELFTPLLSPLLRWSGAFPVRRGQNDVQAVETAVRLCREGKVVAMFPEGTRRTKGLRKKVEHRPRSGSARIALAAGVPLVPAAVKGTDRLSRLAKLKVAYGRPVPLERVEGKPISAAAQEATDELMERIYALHSTL
jgi:1-acyl-sn-glycerol-3-phosphate acyltransferase